MAHAGDDGLIYVSELAWGPVRQVTDVVQLGEQVTVKVIRLNRKRDQIMLSLRQVGGDQHASASLI